MPSKPYPTTDEIEVNGINLLEKKLQSSYIKTFINSRDKIPNNDGDIELLDESRAPIGRFSIQVKTQSIYTETCQIDTSAFDYSQSLTTPFIYFYVSLDNETVRWLHITKRNNIFKEGVKTLTISGRSLSKIDDIKNDLGKWLIIIKKYQDSNQFFLNSYLEEDFSPNLETVPNMAKFYFDDYCCIFNGLLMSEAKCLINSFFPNYTRIGVIIIGLNNTSIMYCHQSIPRGSNKPYLALLNTNKNKNEVYGNDRKRFWKTIVNWDSGTTNAIEYVAELISDFFIKKRLFALTNSLLNERSQKFSLILYWIIEKPTPTEIRVDEIILLYEEIKSKLTDHIRQDQSFAVFQQPRHSLLYQVSLLDIRKIYKGYIKKKPAYSGPLTIEAKEYDLFVEGENLVRNLKESELKVIKIFDDNIVGNNLSNLYWLDKFLIDSDILKKIESYWLNNKLIEEYILFLEANNLEKERSMILLENTGVVLRYTEQKIVGNRISQYFFLGFTNRRNNELKIIIEKLDTNENGIIINEIQSEETIKDFLFFSISGESPIYTKKPLENLLLTFLKFDSAYIFPYCGKLLKLK